MQSIAYLAAVAGSAVSVLTVRWAFRRFDIGGKKLGRAAVAAGAVLAGSLAYFLIGLLLLFVHPARAQQNWSAVQGNFAFGVKLIMFATIAASFALGRAKTKAAPSQPEGDIRERLLKARADIQGRIESLQASPVLNYRGGVPEPDLIIEELVEKLREIDAALAALETK